MEHRKIVIFIPKSGKRITYEGKFIESLIAAKDYLIAKSNEIPFTFSISQYFCHTFPIDANRNECVSMAIKNNIDLSIFFDTDHVLPHDVLYKMIKHDLPIVAGVYYLTGEPHPPVIYKLSEEANDFNLFNAIYLIGDTSIYDYKNLFEADATGAGCFAISLDVLKKLKRPYFSYRPLPVELLPQDEKAAFSGKKDLDEDMKNLLDDWNPDVKFKIDNEVFTATEDIWFWKNVRFNTDYKLIVDPTIVLPHGPLDIWVDATYSKAFYNVGLKKSKQIKKCRVEPIKVSKNGKLVDA